MGDGYVRQSAADIVNGADVEAPPLNLEFNALQAAFHATTGHSHDGTTGEGPQINLVSSVTGILPAANGGLGGSGLTASVTEINVLDGIPATLTATELGYVDGVTSAIQAQLNAKQPLDATLTALAAYNTNGLLVQTAADTFAGRTITGTANEIEVTNGNGVSGNPTIGLPDNVEITTLLGVPSVVADGVYTDAVYFDATGDSVSLTYDPALNRMGLEFGAILGSLQIRSTDASTSGGPDIILYRESATPAVSDGLGTIYFYGKDDAGNQTQYGTLTAGIMSPTNGSESSQVILGYMTNGIPAGFIQADGDTGTIKLGHSSAIVELTGGQFKFPASQNSSANANTLDDYEEGTFTPAFSSTGATFSYTTQTGWYTKVGNVVTFGIVLTLNTSGNTLTANALSITGMPFATANNVYFDVKWISATSSYVNMSALLSGTTLSIRGITAAATSSNAIANSNAALHATNGSTMFVTGSYVTA